MRQGIDTELYLLDRKTLEQVWQNTTHPLAMKIILTDWPMELARGRVALPEYEAFWAEQPCMLWTPTDPNMRHVDIRIRGRLGTALVHVHRVVWAATRQIVKAQGDPLRGDEEIHHSCENRGRAHSAIGVCLNPKCLWRGAKGSHHDVREINQTLKRLGKAQPGVIGSAVTL